MDEAARRAFFACLKRAIPNPTTELVYNNHYQLLVAVTLSAQATDISVNKATQKLFCQIKTPSDMLTLGEIKLIEYIRSIGLFKTKARNVIALSQILVKQHQSQIPQTRDELEALPGVGRKTANVVLNTAFGMPTIAVDTHIFRVANRTELAVGKNVKQVEEELLRVVPRRYKKNAHHWLILLGRYTCRARKPLCPECQVRRWCLYRDKVK